MPRGLTRRASTVLLTGAWGTGGTVGMLANDLGNGISLRPVRRGDAAFERMLHEAQRWDLQLADASRDYLQTVVETQQRMRDESHGEAYPNALYFVVEKTGTPCGRLMLDFDEGFVHIVDFAIMPDAQGKGIGTTVLRALQATATNIPAPVVITVAWQDANELAAVRSLGFEAAAQQPHPGKWYMVWRPAAPAGA